MKDYIIYTTEGNTIAPNEHVEVSNCQVLGIVEGMNEEDAKEKLMQENHWIQKAGFHPSNWTTRQVLF